MQNYVGQKPQMLSDHNTEKKSVVIKVGHSCRAQLFRGEKIVFKSNVTKDLSDGLQ